MSVNLTPTYRGPVIAFVASLAVLSGCLSTPSQEANNIIEGCLSSSTCPVGLQCLSGSCVGATAPPGEYRLRFRPHEGQTVAAAESDNFTFEDSARLVLDPIRLPSPVRVTMRARSLGGQRVGGRFVARVQTDGPPPIAYEGEALSDPGDPRSTIDLPRYWPTASGALRPVLYEVQFYPREAYRFPPWRQLDLRVLEGIEETLIELPDESELITYTGQFLVSRENTTPIPGLDVFAVDAQGRTISTTTQTDELGQFTLRFWPLHDGQPMVVRVRRTAASGPMPNLDLPGFVSQSVSRVPSDNQLFAEIESTTSTFLGLGIVQNVDPIPGAALRFSGRVGLGIYRVDVPSTDAVGTFTVSLYAGEYDIDIIPPQSTGYRLSRLRLELNASTDLNFSPLDRTLVSGLVIDPGGNSIPGARVRASLQSALYADPTLIRPNEKPPARTDQSQTDEDGAFVLRLDPGVHRIRVEPPQASGLPPYENELTVPALTSEIPAINLRSPSAAVIETTLQTADGAPASMVVAEVWKITEAGATRLATGLSDESGKLTLRLASSVEP